MNCCIGAISSISEKNAIKAAKEFEGLKGMDLAKVVSTEKEYEWRNNIIT